MVFSDELMNAAIAGAHSVAVGGWMKEECESAALERLVRHPCLTSTKAFTQGKLAAIDELRFLTHHRRFQREITVLLDDEEKPIEETGFLETLNRIECERILNFCSPRVKEIFTLMMYGYSQTEIGKRLEVSSSRISQLIARDLRRMKTIHGL